MSQEIKEICMGETNDSKSEKDSNADRNVDNNNKIFIFIFSLLSAVQKYITKSSSSESQLFLLMIFYTILIAGISYYGGILSCKF